MTAPKAQMLHRLLFTSGDVVNAASDKTAALHIN